MKVNMSAYITGIPLIDNQHEAFMKMLEDFHNLSSRPDTKFKNVSDELSKVLDYAEEHFKAEEYLMQSVNYPDTEEHLSKHNFFRDKTHDFTNEINNNPDLYLSFFIDEIRKAMHDWFLNQILVDDVKLADYIKKKQET